jgi:hypothetical protein
MRRATGNVLPLSLMMTMIILLAGMGLGLIVTVQSRRSVESDQAVFAYHMADAGIERQLFDLRKKNVLLASYAGTSQSYLNGGSWFSTTGLLPTSLKKFPVVGENSFSVVDLFDPDDATAVSQVCKLEVKWSDDPATCSGSEHALIEASYGYWEVVGGVPRWPTDNQFIILDKSIEGNLTNDPMSLPLTIAGLQTNRAYRIRLRAYNCSAKDVTVQAYKMNGPLCNDPNVSFPGDITLSSQGNYLLASQKISVTMPKQDILSGVFSYVIFSETEICKPGAGIVCP